MPCCLKAAWVQMQPLAPSSGLALVCSGSFPAGKDGRSALKAEAESWSLGGAEIYCSRKLKMHTSCGVSLALPVPGRGKRGLCWGGIRDTGKNSQVTEHLGGELLLLLEGWGLTRSGAGRASAEPQGWCRRAAVGRMLGASAPQACRTCWRAHYASPGVDKSCLRGHCSSFI